ncbi:MAG: long-chain acyl-CoA synthetase [Saprospiraceae bacterium]|jgi:long-chain acyl-CoA synthetase
METNTLIEFFYKLELEKADQPYLHQPFGDTWETYTYREAGQMARKLARALLSKGLPQRSHIGLVSKNCREWVIADLAIGMAGFVSVPFFPTLTGSQISEVLRLGDVALLIVGKTEVWDDMGQGVPSDMPIIKFPHYENCSIIERGEAWNDIMNSYPALEGNPSPSLDDLWTIVFTSGTTGTPKGVMLNYSAPFNLLKETEEYNALELSKTGGNRYFSFLPLNHIAERAIVENGCLAYGGEMFFTESLESFAKNLAHAKPTVFFAVPRIWTKLMLGVLKKIPQAQLEVVLQDPQMAPVIKAKLAAGLGLQNSRCNVSGAAPIPQSTKEWFASIGIPISEGYGMTENCAACTFMKISESKAGSVGRAQNGVQLMLAPESNEILMKASFNMEGYYKSPEQTAKTIVDGWLHTGDQGRIDEDGYLFITGRVKDTFKTAKGEFIVPAKIEEHFSANSDIEQLCLLGLGLPQPVLIAVLSEIGMAKSKDAVSESIAATMQSANSILPNYQRVATTIIAKNPFSIESDTLTPTLKVKRNQLHNLYKDRLLEYCNLEEHIIWELT